MQAHPAAELFPMMDGDGLRALAHDIAANGLLNPIVTYQGRILDGRNRAAACELASVDPITVEWRDPGCGPVAWVVSQNLKRRHLTPGQRAVCALPLWAGRRKHGRPKKLPDLGVFESRDDLAELFAVSPNTLTAAAFIEECATDLLERVASGELALDAAHKQAKRRIEQAEEQSAREIVMADVPVDANGSDWRMLAGDFRERLADLPDGSVDLIITDPPYPAEFQPLWSDLAKHALRVLSDDGILCALSGKIQLAEVMQRLGEHLHYGWIYSQPLPGSHSRILARHVLQAWKPWLAYSKNAWPSGRIDWHPDVLDPSARAKGNFRWEQDPDPSKMLIDALCPPGGTVLDPFTGTGSYGTAALAMGRKFVGVEADADRFRDAVKRLEGAS